MEAPFLTRGIKLRVPQNELEGTECFELGYKESVGSLSRNQHAHTQMWVSNILKGLCFIRYFTIMFAMVVEYCSETV